MKLSVIVPAYNLQDYIEECLLSALQQKVEHTFEVIVCDDCSTDGTTQVIKRLDKQFSHLRAIYKPKNQGLAANMSTLLEACTGDYIAYLDGDDVALPNKLQKQIDHLDNTPDCHMVFHESDMFDSEANQTIKLYSKQFYNWSLIPKRSTINDLIQFGTYMQASSVMFKRHAHLTKTVTPACKIIMDYPFYILNAGYLNANIDFIPDVLGRYRIHANSFGQQTSRSYDRREQSLLDLELACTQAAQFDVAPSIIEKGVAHHRFSAALYFLSREANELFFKYINASTQGQHFFNAKHCLAYNNRHQPQKLMQMLENVA